jgi:hypothetical protein
MALTDPVPQQVSLVFAGANKTPFKAVRAEGVPQGDDDVMTDVSIKSDTHAIVRIDFAATKFADEASVKAWLDDGGYEDYTINAGESGGFFVTGEGGEGEVIEIDTTDITGTKVQVVAVKSDDVLELTPAEQVPDAVMVELAEVHPGAEIVVRGVAEMRQKYCDCFDSPCCSTYIELDPAKSVGERLDQTLDGVPPGLLEVVFAMYDAIRNNLIADDTVAARACISEFASLFDKMVKLFPDPDTATEAQKSMKAAFLAAVAPEVDVTKATENEIVAETPAVIETKSEETPAVVVTTEGDAAPADAGTIVVEAEKTEGEVAPVTEVTAEPAVVATIEGGTVVKSDDPMAALIATVGQLAASVSEMATTMSTKQDALAERVAAVEDTRQTRKGADVDEAGTGSTTPAESSNSANIAEMRTRSVLGMRGPAPTH